MSLAHAGCTIWVYFWKEKWRAELEAGIFHSGDISEREALKSKRARMALVRISQLLSDSNETSRVVGDSSLHKTAR